MGALFAITLAGAAEDPQYGGIFRIASDEASNLNSILLTDGPSAIVVDNQIYETLVVYEPGLTQILPWLAASWENPDDLTWVFHLRRGETQELLLDREDRGSWRLHCSVRSIFPQSLLPR
jgi:peptide/nickel transport system substrate-binding protein